MALSDRQYKPLVLSKDLTAAQTNVAEGLTKKINTLTVLSLGGGSLSFKLDANTNTSITGSDGLKIEGIPITEVYWTNVAQPAITATIFVAWVD